MELSELKYIVLLCKHIVTERCLSSILSRYHTNIRRISSSQHTKQLLPLQWDSQQKNRETTDTRANDWKLNATCIAWMHWIGSRQMNMKNSFDEFSTNENFFCMRRDIL